MLRRHTWRLAVFGAGPGLSDIGCHSLSRAVVTRSGVERCLYCMEIPVRDHAPYKTIDAWMSIYDKRASDLTRFATLLVGGSDAEDVVSDAMIGVLRAVADRDIQPSAAYLFRTVSNTAKNHLRAQARRRQREHRVVQVKPTDGSDSQAMDLQPLLEHLSDRQREIVFLTYWLDLRPADVADHLDIAEGTVRSQLARARRILRGVLDD